MTATELIDIAAQVVIPLTGAVAIFLSQCRTRDKRRWAPVLGIIGQPAWFATALINEQWGVLAISFFYAYAWLRGLHNHWLRGEG